MRKFYVRYEYNWHTHAGPDYGNIIITLEEGEKANIETFGKKVKRLYESNILESNRGVVKCVGLYL